MSSRVLLVPAIRLMSAKPRLQIGLRSMDMEVWWSWSISRTMFSTKMLSITDDRHLSLKESFCSVVHHYTLVHILSNFLMTGRDPLRCLILKSNVPCDSWQSQRTFDNRWSCDKGSDDAVDDYLSRWLKICSPVLLPSLKPTCSSARSFSVAMALLFLYYFQQGFACVAD